MVKKFWIDIYTLLYFKWVTNKGLQGLNVICYLNGREVWGRMDTWICMVESLQHSPETITALLISYAAAKSLQSCPTLCDPTESSPPGSPIPGIFQARTLEWVAIAFSVIRYSPI